MLQVTRSVRVAVSTFVVAAVIALASGISSAAPASASTAAGVTGENTSVPSPLGVIVPPLIIGLYVIDTIAEGMARAVSLIATPAPIAIPAPDSAAGS